MYSYSAYDLGIRSELPLPGLVEASNPPADVSISLRKLRCDENPLRQSSDSFRGETLGVGKFWVRHGSEIVVDPAPLVDESLLRTILLGPIMAVLLRQRGFAVLHASGVAINHVGIAFVAQSGFGKSTLAGAFYDLGYGLVTDDVMAVRVGGDCPYVLTAYPSIKLFPDSAAAFGCEAPALHRVNSQTEKWVHSVAERFPIGPLPLKRIYVLAFGNDNKLEGIRPQDAFFEIARNSRAATLLTDTDSRREHLRHCAWLAERVPVLRLRRQRDLSMLPVLVELIEDDLARCGLAA